MLRKAHIAPRASLDDFPITRRWPAADPAKLQLYSLPTPNGQKVSIALEELGIGYEPHRISIADGDNHTPEFLSLNPNNKIPAIIDPDGPGGAPLALFESGAILIYLAEKAGRLLGTTPAERTQVIQWLMFQMGGIGPMFGQVGYFCKNDGRKIEDPRPRTRYLDEARRLLAVIEAQLEGRDWIADGGFSIADIALGPWLQQLEDYGAREAVDWSAHAATVAYLDRFNARPAVRRGRTIPSRGP